MQSLGPCLFVSLWAFAIIFDSAWMGHLATLSARTPVAIVALWAMFRPSSLSRFLSLIALQTVVALVEQPAPGNHWFFMVVMHLTMVLALVGGSGAPTLDELRARFAPAIRVEVIVLYSFAALSKLNPAFLDPDTTCAALFYSILADIIPVLPVGDAVVRVAALAAVATETAIPLLLLIPRTRAIGALLGVLFHAVLALAGAPSFSVAAFALLSLFLPSDVLRGVEQVARRVIGFLPAWGARPPLPPSVCFVILAAAMVIPGAATAYGLVPAGVTIYWVSRVFWLLWLLAAAILSVLLLAGFAARDRAERLGTVPLVPARAVLWIGPFLAVLNGLSPYVGAKTENSFTMFSNLRTEGGYWNHLVVPRGVRVFGMQDDIVRVVDSSDPGLKALAENGSLLVLPHLRQLASRSPEAWVTYEQDGLERHVPRIAADELLAMPAGPPLLWRLLAFRVVPPDDACQH